MKKLLLTAVVLCAPAGATTMTFDSPSVTRLPRSTQVNSDTEGGFKLTRTAGTISPGGDPDPAGTNGQNLFFAAQPNGSSVAIFSLVATDGSAFTLTSFDTAGLGRFAITGLKAPFGTSNSRAYAYNADFATPLFSTYQNTSGGVDYRDVAVNEVDFTVYTFAPGSTGLNLDNVVVNAFVPTAPVPEAASWAMMLAGFGAVGAAARRKVGVRFA